jgi:hypothetical protein
LKFVRQLRWVLGGGERGFHSPEVRKFLSAEIAPRGPRKFMYFRSVS